MTALSTPPTQPAPGPGEVPPEATAYLHVGDGERAFVVDHAPSPAARRDCAVVICPPFGFDELAAHRALRAWALQLAADGFGTVRLTYPGTGDSSGSPRDPDRLGSWIRSAEAAAAWTADRHAVRSVVLLGVGLGAVVALRAARTRSVGGVVLWGCPSRGRELMRQLRVFSRLESAEAFADLPEPPAAAHDGLEVGGFLLTRDTIDALDALDLGEPSVGLELELGALLLDREGHTDDGRVAQALRGDHVAVTTAPGHGYGELTSHPQESRLPDAVLTTVADWLDARSAPSDSDGLTPVDDVPDFDDRLRCGASDGAPIVERTVSLRGARGMLTGVVAEPANDTRRLTGAPCVVFLNAGAIHRIGPNRSWVETARRWAGLGITSVRLDLGGFGEAGGPDRGGVETSTLYAEPLGIELSGALDDLQRRGIADRFLLVGLCSGAYWSLQLILRDPRVVSAALINLTVIEWDEGLDPARSLRTITLQSFLNLRYADTRARMRVAFRWLGRQLRARLPRGGEPVGPSMRLRTETTLERLRVSGKPVLVLFGARETLEAELRRIGMIGSLESWPNITVRYAAIASHTLRPSSAQAWLRAELDAHLDRVLSDCGAGS